MYLISNGSGYWAKGRQGKKRSREYLCTTCNEEDPLLTEYLTKQVPKMATMGWLPAPIVGVCLFVAELHDHLAIFQTKFW